MEGAVAEARVSGLGAVPGTSSVEAAHVIAGECARAPFIPVLAQRGPGADPIGRTGGMLASVSTEFAVETVPSGWKVGGSWGRDMRRADSYFREDLDAMEESLTGSHEPLMLSVVGPVTWAGRVDGVSGEKLIRDHGALRDISTALATALGDLATLLARRFPDSPVVFQIDEPLVMPATEGAIPTASALNTYVALDRQFVASLWAPLFAVAQKHTARYGVNASGGTTPLSDPYISLLRAAGASRFYGVEQAAELGDIIDSGAECVWPVTADRSGEFTARDMVRRLKSLGFAVETFAPNTVVVPSDREMNGGWEAARNAWNRAQTAVDLLNDPDRLESGDRRVPGAV